MAANRPRPPALPEELRPPAPITRDEYLVWRSPRIGQGNPDRFRSPVWEWLARARELSAYQANQRFDGPTSFDAGPAWCNQRFGQSRTELPDGRVVRIAGEHEDGYDPDFFIYNDVIVESPSGEIAIYGYPQDVFGPTDFHSATRVGDDIFVVGNLGYPLRRRLGTTPVVKLDTRSFAMTPIAVEGAPPGWIHKHRAELSADARALVISGGTRVTDVEGETAFTEARDDWSLDLGTLRWARLTDRRGEEWALRREDDRMNELWRRDLAYRFGGDGETTRDAFAFEGLGDPKAVLANRGLHEARYSPPVPHENLTTEGDDAIPLVLRRRIEGVVVRYVEDMSKVSVIIEGELPSALVATIVDDACAKLSELEGARYTKRRVS